MLMRYLIIIFMFLGFQIKASEVSQIRAELLATRFINAKYTNEQRIIDHTFQIYYHNKVLLYAVNFASNKGFVLISADDRAKAVVAYSDYGNFDNYNTVKAVNFQIEEYCKEIEFIIQNNISANNDIKSQWKNFGISTESKGPTNSIGPLLTTTWSQGCYYNDSTPYDAGATCQHVVTGCVATAMSQVINYYNFPLVGSGIHSYNSNYGTLTANFGNTNYNWSTMADNLSATSSAAEVASVAQLISHAGIAVDMMYSAGSSGAYSQDAANAFTHYFNFDNGLRLHHKNNYSDSIWEQMIIRELDSLRPVYYDGSGTGGHAFVCDGYQNGNYFHFNWGWSGSYNGYFSLSNLNPSGMNFSNYCGAVLGMKPGVPNSNFNSNDTLTEASGNFSDGSYSNFYHNNSNCSWLISPAYATSIKIDFYTMDIESGDSVYVYDGNGSSAPLIGAYSGDSLPPTIYSSSPQVFVHFVSNNIGNAAGWSASYQSEYCQNNISLTAISGNISDGSGMESYNNNTNCQWLISDSSQSQIILEFDDFKTESGFDFVSIYDGNSANGTLLGTFSGHNLPPVLTSNSGNMFIKFTSDGGVIDEGWSAHYTICIIPEAPYNIDSASICFGDSILLNIDSIITNFTWVYNGTALSNVTMPFLFASQSGNYSYTANQAGCSASNSPIFTLNVKDLPIISLGNDTNICVYNNLILDAGNFSSFIWNTGDTNSTLFIDSNIVNQFGNNFWVSVKDSNYCNNSDTINITLSECLSIKSANDLDKINIFPNPAEDKLWIINLEGKRLDISIVDNNGKEVISKQVREDRTIELNISVLSSGVYFLILNQCTNYRSIKFIKQ